MRAACAVVLALCVAGDCAAEDGIALDDPRPEGRLSMRERSLCEPPESRPDWCTYPHEVRDFVRRRDACDHLRGEPAPEGDGDEARQRRRDLANGMAEACTGSDETLSGLLARYRDDPVVAPLLATFERDVEP